MRNRLDRSSEQTGSLDKLQDTPYITKVSDESYLEQQVCLFGPESYEPRYEYPLVIWLHSCASSEQELENVMPELSMRNYVACAPRGTVACDADGSYYRWGNSAASAAIAEELVFESVALASEHFSIHPKRVFLAGFGSGASMAWRIGLRYPKRFGGVISICGQFPQNNQPLTNLPLARQLPTLWIYGEHSKTCGVKNVCDTMPLMHAARLSVDIRQYPCGDELLANMLEDSNAWLMEQVTSQPVTSEKTIETSFSQN